jgi:glycine/D-amino acid oxidase-like deaminating enzyme
VKVYTDIRVISIDQLSASSGPSSDPLPSSSAPIWVIRTENGLEMRARHVIHATNGYGIDLLPKAYQEYMRSVRGQCIAVTAPPLSFPSSLVFHSHPDSCEEYLIQRKDGVVIFGGFRHLSSNRGLDADDNIVEDEVSSALLSFLQKLRPGTPFKVIHISFSRLSSR